jgi:hypothetical protein
MQLKRLLSSQESIHIPARQEAHTTPERSACKKTGQTRCKKEQDSKPNLSH